MNHDALAPDSVRAQDFGSTEDGLRGGGALSHFPSLGLALAAFPGKGRAPVWANVLFSREHPQGHVATIDADTGPLHGLRFDADQTDAALESAAWLPDADWPRLTWTPLHGDTANGPRFIAPYPASLLKIMVAVGVARLVDAGRASWDEPCVFEGRSRRAADWAEDMIVVSSNEATSALVALLHRAGGIVRGIDGHRRHCLVVLLSSLGSRYAPDQICAVNWRLPALGAAIDARLAAWLEA